MAERQSRWGRSLVAGIYSAIAVLSIGLCPSEGLTAEQSHSPDQDAAAAAEDATRATVVLIDASVVTGRFSGSPDGRTIELGTDTGPETLRVDEIMSLTFRSRDGLENGRPRDETDRPPVTFHLADGGRIHGTITGEGTTAVKANTSIGDEVSLPLDHLAGIQLVRSTSYERASGLFFKALSERLPGQDVLITRGVEDAKSLRGRLDRLDPTGGSFSFGERVRTFSTDRVFGIVLAIGTRRSQDHSITVELVDGSVLSGRLVKADHDVMEIATSLGFDVGLPIPTIARLDFQSPRVVYLSDLSPLAERTEGRVHKPWPMRRDQSVAGGPLSLGGKRFRKGLGVHSRTELDYDIGGGFETFVAEIGIDDAVVPRGSVTFRVLGDGVRLYESPIITGESKPRICKVDIRGVTVLTLSVDYGDDLDLSDHADWGAARILREPRYHSVPSPAG